MNKPFEFTRRGFLLAVGAVTAVAAMGVGFARDAKAAAMDFIGKRQVGVYEADAKVYKIRKSQDNPMIKKIYAADGFLSDGPTGKTAYKLLHTRYFDRSADIKELKAKGVKLKV